MRRALPTLLAALSLPAAAVEPLGRLFFTPAHRAALDKQQREAQAASATLAVQGVVARSSGKSTVWINGRPLHENAGDPGMRILVSSRQPAQVTLVDAAGRVTLRVGETVVRPPKRRSNRDAAR